MGFLQNSNISASISWTQRDSTSSSTVIDSSSVEYLKLFASGTGISQCDKVYYASGTLSSGQNQQFDLLNLQRSIFGSVQTITFSGGKIKSFYLENGGSAQCNLQNTGNNSFQFNFLGSGIILWPSGYFSCSNLTGWNISTGNRYFGLINNTTGTVPYEIAILGN